LIKKYSISDIANELKVSKTTVSFVLNKRDKSISPQTRKRILDFVKKVGYKPNSVAKALKEGKTNTIGYLVPDISNPFYGNIARKIEQQLDNTPYQLIIGSTDESEQKESEIIHSLLDRQIDGLILASCNIKAQVIQSMLTAHFPLVLFDRMDPEISANYIMVNSHEKINEALSLWIKKGIKRIGLLSITPEISSLKERIDNFKDTLTQKGIDYKDEWIRTVDKDDIKESCHVQLKALFSQDIEAIFFTNNLVCMQTLWHLKKNFPEQIQKIKLLSFDNIDFFDLAIPPVISIAQPINEIASSSVNQMLKLIKNPESKTETKLLEPTVIYR
jgi:LacI family transcriptional regulator, galactose operon repressor